MTAFQRYCALTPTERRAVRNMIGTVTPFYYQKGGRVQLHGTYSVDELIDIAIELETKAKQTNTTVAAFDHLMGAA